MQLDYLYHKTKCSKCKRPILIERFLFGVAHEGVPNVICAECISIPLNKQFTDEHPEAAEDIKNWINELANLDNWNTDGGAIK